MEDKASPLALIDLLCALLAAALWYVRPELGPWPLVLVAAGLVVRHLVEPRPVFELTGMDAAVALFAVSTLIGLLLAYNRANASAKFYQIIAGVALYGAIARAPALVKLGRWNLAPVRVLLALLPSAIAAYFIVTVDYTQLVGKLRFFDSAVRQIALWMPGIPFDRLNPNVAGGMIAALLPLQVAALWGRKEGYLLLPVSVAGLLLSLSRGAWLAVAVVATALLALAAARSRRRNLVAVAAATTVVLIVLVVLVVPTILAQSGEATPVAAAPSGGEGAGSLPAIPAEGGSTATGRATLFGNALGLAWDYALTGLGLDGFSMAFSSYVLMLHVGHTSHSHNLFLDVWLGQGLLGLIALVWLLASAAVAVRRVLRFGERTSRVWALAAASAVAVMYLNGLINDSFYGSRGVVFFFIPFAVLACEQAWAVWQADEELPSLWESLSGRTGVALACAAVAILLASLLPQARSQLQANLGALAQTRAELSVYEWPAWPIQDELRRSPEVQLDEAVARYEEALALDASNATANRRLGQIVFSRGDYSKAGQLLAAAYRSGYTSRATRQLYGEWLAINGRPQEAAALWRTIDMSQGQVAGRAWWFEHIGKPEYAKALRLAESMR